MTIENNQYGIVNSGEMTIDNLNLNKSLLAGICNKERATIIINSANFEKEKVITANECPRSDDDPLIIPIIAGNVAGVIY
ncbi:MAG: hypothetical protein EA365_04500 [Gloeocapsa sp. DLM2.Bin57]|nr:MAG: hypothetical protein EA365_04500 [Gloeocapsa sp. DLM2.Bin57]